MNDKKTMTAILLAGGHSSRMGYHPKQALLLEGKTFQERILGQFSGFGEIAISGREKENGSNDDPLWPDELPDLGPLGGFYTCLKRAAYDVVFFVACDYPCMTRECVEWIIGQLTEEDDCVIPVTDGQGQKSQIHPVCGLYRKRIFPVVEKQIIEGNRAMKSMLEKISVRYVKVPESYIWCFQNVNTPEEYERVKKLSER